MGFNNILLVHDGRESARAVLEHAVDLVRSNKGRLTVVDVVSELPLRSRMVIGNEEAQRLQGALIEERREQLTQLIARVGDSDARLEVDVLCGSPFYEITRRVISKQHDLVIDVAGRERGLKHAFLGTTALHLMRKCPCPIWVWDPGWRPGRSRVLAAVDASATEEDEKELNKMILETAAELAADGELHVLSAWSLFGESLMRSARSGMSADQVDAYHYRAMTIGRSEFDRLLTPFAGPQGNLQAHFIEGDPGELIPLTVERHEIDILVMGTLARSGRRGFLIGNTAERVLQDVNCSVLTLKPGGFRSPIE